MESESTIFVLVVALVLAQLGYAFFVLSSVAALRSRRSVLREMKGLGVAKIARRVLHRADRYLLVAQIGKFLLGVIGGACLVLLIQILQPMLLSQGRILPDIGLILALLFFATVSALTLVQFAKAVAYAAPERALSIAAIPLLILGWMFSPLVFLLEELLGAILRAVGLGAPIERQVVMSAEDLSEIVQKSTEAGEIEEDERELIEGVIGLGETHVSEVMTPRKDVVTVSELDSLDVIVSTVLEAGYSRILVIGEELDDVKGMLLAKDLLPLLSDSSKSFALADCLRKPVFVDGRHLIDDVLRQLRSEAAHLAVVLDEHGGVDGVVTMEDLIEEIVGDIFDETDSPEDEIDVTQTRTGDLIVDGGASLDDLNEEHDLRFPEGEYDTVAGFVIHSLGRIPEVGEEIRYNGSLVRVEEVDQNRITQLRIMELDGDSSPVQD